MALELDDQEQFSVEFNDTYRGGFTSMEEALKYAETLSDDNLPALICRRARVLEKVEATGAKKLSDFRRSYPR